MLAGLAILSLALIPVHITTIYSGLPAHPLFLHVPVILIPLAAIWALVLAVWPRWFVTSGVWLGAVTVVALAGTFLTVGAGDALRNALHLNGDFGPAVLIARHAHAADTLRLLMIAFTAIVIVALLAHRVDAAAGARVFLRVLLGALAIACAYFVFHTGDLGAKAVWQGRLQGGGGPGGGGPVQQLFGPSGGG